MMSFNVESLKYAYQDTISTRYDHMPWTSTAAEETEAYVCNVGKSKVLLHLPCADYFMYCICRFLKDHVLLIILKNLHMQNAF